MYKKLISALIFDMDDTLIHTSHIWRRAEEHLLKVLNHPWTAELASQYKGMNALDVAATIWRETQTSIALDECQQILRDRLISNFYDTPIEPIKGIPQLLDQCGRVGQIPMAVASGSPLRAIKYALAELGVRDIFQHLITSETVEKGKPHPDVFLAAADQLGVSPDACLVFEDSIIGAKAARSAGMQCIVCPSTTHSTTEDIADAIVDVWSDVTIETSLHQSDPILFIHGKPRFVLTT